MRFATKLSLSSVFRLIAIIDPLSSTGKILLSSLLRPSFVSQLSSSSRLMSDIIFPFDFRVARQTESGEGILVSYIGDINFNSN